jgi:hypothetical protein
VADQEGGRASTGTVEIDNREQPGVGVSDIALVRRLTDLDRPADAGDPFESAGKRVLPFVKNDVPAGIEPSFYFVVYPEPGKAAKPEVRVQLLKDGRPLARSTPKLPPPDASGAIPMVIAGSGDPGSHEVRVTVTQAGVSAESSLAYTVAGERISAPENRKVSDSKPAEDAGTVAVQPAGDDRLASFRRKVRQDMTGVPNYTCLETIDRTKRVHTAEFLPIDKIRLEVSVVGGKEMFARPGARSFDNRDVTSLVPGGLIGSGMFSSLTRTLFVKDKGTLKYRGKDDLDGQASVRYDFRLTRQESGFKVQIDNRQEPLAFKGSFWFEPATLDLLRLEAHADALPADLNVEEAFIRTAYARTHIGNSDALLPKRSELTATYLSGATERDAIEFSGCHEYASESTISFGAPSGGPPAGQPQVRGVDLPAGLLLPIELETPIDSETAAVGDTLHARVVEDVRYLGNLLAPRGAAVTGRISKWDRISAPERVVLGMEFGAIEWETGRAAFQAELVEIDGKSAGANRPAAMESTVPGVAVFRIDAAQFRIAPGFHMVWRTLAGAAGAGQ